MGFVKQPPMEVPKVPKLPRDSNKEELIREIDELIKLCDETQKVLKVRDPETTLLHLIWNHLLTLTQTTEGETARVRCVRRVNGSHGHGCSLRI